LFTFNSNLDNDGHTYIVLITIYNKGNWNQLVNK